MADWAQQYLQSKGYPTTAQNITFLHDWQRREGGATNNSATFNYLNSTRGDQFPKINSIGVRAYPDQKTGFDYLDQTIHNGNYPHIVAGLSAGNPYKYDVKPDLSTWVSGSSTSPSGASYAAKVLNTHTTGSDPLEGVRAAAARMVQPTAPAAPDNRRQLLQYLQAQSSALIHGTKAPGVSDFLSNLPTPPTTAALPHKGTTPAALAPVTGDPAIDTAIKAAHKQVGLPYVFGTESPGKSFDCSGLIQYAYAQAGIKIPRATWEQAKVGTKVGWGNFQPGDLIFSNHGEHVVMYVGNGQVIAAPHTGTQVQYQPLTRFASSFVQARRIIKGPL